MSAPWQTDLLIGGAFLPYGSARGLSVSVQPISAGEIRRTINGGLVDLTRATHRKYRVQISGQDMITPTLADFWPGMLTSMRIPVWFRQSIATPTSTITISRNVLSDADARVFDALGTPVAFTRAGRVITAAALGGEQGWVEYLPFVEGRVIERTEQHQEWAASANWSLTVEEI